MGYCHSRLGLHKKALVNFHLALERNPADTSSEELLEDTKKALLSAGETPEDIQTLEVNNRSNKRRARPCKLSRRNRETLTYGYYFLLDQRVELDLCAEVHLELSFNLLLCPAAEQQSYIVLDLLHPCMP